jgi:hypothetical protein
MSRTRLRRRQRCLLLPAQRAVLMTTMTAMTAAAPFCMDAPRTAALVPCGHALLCDACAAKVLATAAPLCPVCRVVATGVRAAP